MILVELLKIQYPCNITLHFAKSLRGRGIEKIIFSIIWYVHITAMWSFTRPKDNNARRFQFLPHFWVFFFIKQSQVQNHVQIGDLDQYQQFH